MSRLSLKKQATGVRIDWGYMYVAAPKAVNATQFITTEKEAVNAFRTGVSFKHSI
jgi:hypothetical protein